MNFTENCPTGFIKHDENCYMASNETLSWHDARQACASFAGNYDLAIVETEELFEFLKKYDSHWIGLYSRKGKREFKWVDGTALDYEKYLDTKPWSNIEPNVSYLSFISSHKYLYHLYYFLALSITVYVMILKLI